MKGLAEMTTLTAAGIDTRHVPEPMEECQPEESKPSTETPDRNIVRSNRDKDREERIETRESNDFIESRDSLIRESRKSAEQWEPRDLRDIREPHEVIHVRDLVEARDTRECRDFREERGSKEPREYMDVRELRESTDHSPPRVSPLLSVRRFRLETSTENMATPTHPPIPKHEPPDDPPRSLSPDEVLLTRANGAQSEAVGEFIFYFIWIISRYLHKIHFAKPIPFMIFSLNQLTLLIGLPSSTYSSHYNLSYAFLIRPCCSHATHLS